MGDCPRSSECCPRWIGMTVRNRRNPHHGAWKPLSCRPAGAPRHHRESAAREHTSRTLRCYAMPAYSPPYRQTPELPRLPVPAAPTLTHDGRCSACHGVPTSICQGEVQVCRGCLAVLWHLRRPAATPKHRPPARAPDAQGAEAPASRSHRADGHAQLQFPDLAIQP